MYFANNAANARTQTTPPSSHHPQTSAWSPATPWTGNTKTHWKPTPGATHAWTTTAERSPKPTDSQTTTVPTVCARRSSSRRAGTGCTMTATTINRTWRTRTRRTMRGRVPRAIRLRLCRFSLKLSGIPRRLRRSGMAMPSRLSGRMEILRGMDYMGILYVIKPLPTISITPQ